MMRDPDPVTLTADPGATYIPADTPYTVINDGVIAEHRSQQYRERVRAKVLLLAKMLATLLVSGLVVASTFAIDDWLGVEPPLTLIACLSSCGIIMLIGGVIWWVFATE